MTTPLQQRRRVESARAWAWFVVVLGALMITFNLAMMALTSTWNSVWAQLGLGVFLTISSIVTLRKNPKPQGPDPAPQRTPTPEGSPGESENV